MNPWIERMIDALTDPSGSLTVVVQLIVIIAISVGAATRRAGNNMLLVRQFKPRYMIVQALTLVIGLQLLNVWLGMIGYPQRLVDSYPVLAVIAGCSLVAVVLLWAVYGFRRRKAPHFVSGLFHLALMVPLQLMLIHEYSLLLNSGNARTLDYLISWPVAVACLILFSQLTYASRGVYVRSIGQADHRTIRGSELKLLFTLRATHQVLQDRSDPSCYYLHDLSSDQYYQFCLANESDRPYARRVRRHPPKLMPVETAAAMEIPPRRQRRR